MNNFRFCMLALFASMISTVWSENITFADAMTKAICVSNWDADKDGELSISEASGVTTLGNAFCKSQITSFDELRFFTGLSSIGKDAFSYSTVKTITLPETIKSIKENAFLYCPSLTSITIPANVQSIGQNALSGCTSMTSITVDETNAFFCSVDDVLFNKDKTCLVQYPAAKGTEYTVPDGTLVIGRDAFFMSTIQSVSLPSTLKELAYDAFGACYNLTDLVIPEGVKNIGSYILDQCYSLKTLYIPSSVKTIGGNICKSCYAIKDVYCDMEQPYAITDNCFPETVYQNATLYVPAGKTSLYKSCTGWKNFERIQENIVKIEFADPEAERICLSNWDTDEDGKLSVTEAASVTTLGTVFSNSKIDSFDELRFFLGLTSIGKDAFKYSTVRKVTLPENIKSLEENAFLYCSSLTAITIPANVQSIRQNALSGCTAMTSITVDESNSNYCSVDGVLFSKDKTTLVQYPAAKGTSYSVPGGTTVIGRDAFFMGKLSSIELPSSLKKLEYDAFGYCTSLKEIRLREGVVAISDYAFDWCTLLNILYIPSTVESIGQKICNNCNSLTDIYCDIATPFDINVNNFPQKVYDNATLNVPERSQNLYRAAGGWGKFGKIQGSSGQITESGIEMTVPDVMIVPGGTANLTISLENVETTLNGYQFIIELPSGLSLSKDESGEYIYELSERYSQKDNMVVNISKTSPQTYQLVCFSLSGEVLKEVDGPVITLKLSAGDEIEDSNVGTIRDILLSDIEGKTLHVGDKEFNVSRLNYTLGDTNGDGSVNVTDVMLIVYYILGNPLPAFYEEVADMNGDARIDVTDALLVVNIILNGNGQIQSNAVIEPSDLRLSVSDNVAVLQMIKMSEYTSCQMDVRMPSGTNLLRTEMFEASTGHSVMINNIGDDVYRVIVYSLGGETLKDTGNGNLLRFVADSDINNTIRIENILFSNDVYETVRFSDIAAATGIETIEGNHMNDDSYYQINGIKVNQPNHGLYIRNGKKFFLK